ncbi:hypothetical protein D3C71_1776410 [compost metagenome]
MACHGIASIDGALEVECHCRRQPADLAADFGHQAGGQQTVGYRCSEVTGFGEMRIEMHRIVVAGNLRKALDVILREAAGEGEAIARLKPFGCTLSKAFH